MKKCIPFVILAVCALVQTALADDEFFHRKPGLWDISMESDATPGKGRSVKYCLDEKTDAELLKMGESVGQMCSKHEMHREGSTYISSSICSLMGSTITSNGVFKGDFSSRYEGEINSSYNPPFMGKTKGHMKVSGHWLGACTAGQQPGDMIMPNGMTMNINKMAAMGKAQMPTAKVK